MSNFCLEILFNIFLTIAFVYSNLQVPERAKGYFFEYELIKICRIGATIRYTERIYFPGASDFETFKETQDTQTMQYNIKDIEASHELWQTANGKVNARLYHEREKLKKEQSILIDEESKNFCMDDIDVFFNTHGKGSHMLEYDFEADTPEPVPYKKANGEMSIFQCWTHKHTKFSVKRYAAQNGTSVDSGRLSKYLNRIRAGVHPLAYARAQKILALNENVVINRESIESESVVVMDRVDLLKQQVRIVWFYLFTILNSSNI